MISVAVLLSAYNGEKYLKAQLDSILAQEGDFMLELYIRDDGSSDRTGEILREYEERENVHVTYEENAGITASYSELLRTCGEHDYYALSDQDDVWLPGKINAAVRLLEKKKKSFPDMPLLYGCRSYLVDENLKADGQMTQACRKRLTLRNTMIQNILLGHNQVMNQALTLKLREEKADLSEIYAHDMWITSLAALSGKIFFENEPYTLYRQHKNNELGFGSRAGSPQWILIRIRRALHGESRLVARQFKCFFKVHGSEMSENDRSECEAFLNSQKTLPARIRYALQTKFYRQRASETVLFRILYIIGGYRTE